MNDDERPLSAALGISLPEGLPPGVAGSGLRPVVLEESDAPIEPDPDWPGICTI